MTGMILPVLIGVNPPERIAKQRIVADLTFFEAARTSAESGEADYPAIVQQIATQVTCVPISSVRLLLIMDGSTSTQDVERSIHLTLEKLAYEVIRRPIARPTSTQAQTQIRALLELRLSLCAVESRARSPLQTPSGSI